MSSTFFGLTVAQSGLFGSQRALNVTGHNIANASTPGFSRQRLNVVQSYPLALPGGQGMLGTGVSPEGIYQIRDQFLDFKIRKEFPSLGNWEVRANSLQQIESILNEPSDSGIRAVMDEFFAAFQELNKNPDNLTARAQVRQRGIALTKTLNHMYNQLSDMQANLDFSVKTTVDQINGYAKQIADLNKQIFSNELGGNHANDLRDQRNLLIDELSKLVDIEVQESPYGSANSSGVVHTTTMRITIDGMPLVSHFDYKQLKTEARTASEQKNSVDKPGLLNITWDNGAAFKCKGGSLRGLLDMRDNIDGSSKGIPYYMERLNRFATVFAAQFNYQHGQGYGLSGSGTGISFFNYPPLDYTSYPHSFGYQDVTSTVTGSSDEEKIRNFEISNSGYTIFKVENSRFKLADNVLGNPVDFATGVGAGTLTLNGQIIDLTTNVMVLGDNYDATSNPDAVRDALQADIDAVYDGTNHGGITFKVLHDGAGRLVIKSEDASVDLTGSDATAAAALGFTTLPPAAEKWYKVEIVKANNIDLSAKIHDDLNNIAASANDDGTGTSGLVGDGANALMLNELRHNVDMFTWGSPDDFFKSLISNLGVDGQEAIRMTDNQQVLINQIENNRQSISGVSLDEEMANMIKFQHAYNASARMITTVDEMLDKIINGMGVVGR